MKKNLAVWSLFGLAFLANPALFACSSEDEEDFTYSEADMKAAVLGEWQGTAQLEGESVAFTLSLQQASAKSGTQSVSAPPFQPQCGSRSFVKPAAACASISTMPLVGTISSENTRLNGSIEGEAIASRILNPSQLHLELADGTWLDGSLKDQAIAEGDITANGVIGSFTLARP